MRTGCGPSAAPVSVSAKVVVVGTPVVARARRVVSASVRSGASGELPAREKAGARGAWRAEPSVPLEAAAAECPAAPPKAVGDPG